MEGRNADYEKNRGINFRELVNELRAAGIVVLGSVILFTEQHDKSTIHEEIDFAIDAGPDFIQFMQLGPLPTTKLYQSYKIRGLLREDIPYEEWHGQHRLWFRHPHFSGEESEVYLRNAFQRAWDELGASILRLFETKLMGYRSTCGKSDPLLQARNRQFRASCLSYYPALRITIMFAHNKRERKYAKQVLASYRESFGRMSFLSWLKSISALIPASLEYLKIKTVGNLRQPKEIVTEVKKSAIRAMEEVPAMAKMN
jgi:hypothetical protein